MTDPGVIRREIEVALANLRRAMAEVARAGDMVVYRRLADRYALLHRRWERLQPPQVAPQEPQP